MNKKLILGLALVGTIFATSCQKDEKGPAPTNIDASTITATPTEGGVDIRWKIPEGANYRYVRVDYTIPEDNDHRTRLASVYEDVDKDKKIVDAGYKTIHIDNLLHKYGELLFTLTPVSVDGVDGETVSVKATAGALPKVIQFVDKKKVEIDPATQAWVDNPDPGEGPIKDMFDGNPATFYHMDWHNPTPFPHYIVVKLEKPAEAISFDYICRNHGGKINPKRIQVWGSNSFDGTTFDPEAQGAVKAGKELKDLPADKAANYSSEPIQLGAAYQYIWFQILEGHNNPNFSAIAEWKVYRYSKQVYDPETGKTTKE